MRNAFTLTIACGAFFATAANVFAQNFPQPNPQDQVTCYILQPVNESPVTIHAGYYTGGVAPVPLPDGGPRNYGLNRICIKGIIPRDNAEAMTIDQGMFVQQAAILDQLVKENQKLQALTAAMSELAAANKAFRDVLEKQQGEMQKATLAAIAKVPAQIATNNAVISALKEAIKKDDTAGQPQ